MALSNKTKEIMIVALANKVAGQELAAAVNAGVAGADAADASADAAAASALAAAASASDASDSADAAAASAASIGEAAAVADLNQTITNPPSQAEVQAISDKIDELLASLRAAGLLAP